MSENFKQECEEASRKVREYYDDLEKDINKLMKTEPLLSMLFRKLLLIIAFMQTEKYTLVSSIWETLLELSKINLNLINEVRESIPEISEEQINRLDEIYKTISQVIEETRREADRTPPFII